MDACLPCEAGLAPAMVGAADAAGAGTGAGGCGGGEARLEARDTDIVTGGVVAGPGGGTGTRAVFFIAGTEGVGLV